MRLRTVGAEASARFDPAPETNGAEFKGSASRPTLSVTKAAESKAPALKLADAKTPGASVGVGRADSGNHPATSSTNAECIKLRRGRSTLERNRSAGKCVLPKGMVTSKVLPTSS